jgi:hypothetical protein
MFERSITVTRKPAFARKKAVEEPAGPPPTMRMWCMADLLVCEERYLLINVVLVVDVGFLCEFIDDGVNRTALVFEQYICFGSIDLCRIAYMMRHETIENGLLVFISKVEVTSVHDT